MRRTDAADATAGEVAALGERDPVRHYSGQYEAGLKTLVPDLRSQVVVPGAGHWIQQERPEVVNGWLLEFLGSLSED